MYIYILRRKKKVFYVGTTKDYEARYIQHHHVFGDFSMDIIDSYNPEQTIKLERLYIIKYRLEGFKLLNRTKLQVSKKQQKELNDFLLNPRFFDKIIDFKPSKMPKKHANDGFIIPEKIQRKVARNDCSNIFTRYSIKYSQIYPALKGKKCNKEVFFAIINYYSKNNRIDNQ
jgi:hypothetical protein